MQGLNNPANDLSRGRSVDDVYYLIALTSVQTQGLVNLFIYAPHPYPLPRGARELNRQASGFALPLPQGRGSYIQYTLSLEGEGRGEGVYQSQPQLIRASAGYKLQSNVEKVMNQDSYAHHYYHNCHHHWYCSQQN
jgi:hypothetical protein